jgi:triosephosphate isomerase
MKKLIAGNWKMNLNKAEIKTLLGDIKAQLKDSENTDYLVCPPYVYLDMVVQGLQGTPIAVGAQDCTLNDNGAYTGDISAAMLKDIGAQFVILGHSERRTHHKENSALISKKAQKAHALDLISIICVGETLAQRETGQEQETVKQQLLDSLPNTATSHNTIIAYEPVWAIGTGKTASPEDVQAMHGFIRTTLAQHFDGPQNVHILYGGSMKPENAKALLATPNVDGGLIGGASLKADHFLAIGNAA